jgi:hypothetical protein
MAAGLQIATSLSRFGPIVANLAAADPVMATASITISTSVCRCCAQTRAFVPAKMRRR